MGKCQKGGVKSSPVSRRHECGCDCAGCNDQGHHCNNPGRGCHFGEEKPAQQLTGGRWQLPTETYHSYTVDCILCAKEERDVNVGSPFKSSTVAVVAVDEREAATKAMQILKIPWLGPLGVGKNAYLVFLPKDGVHVLVWAHNDTGARSFANAPEAKYCLPVIIKKLPYST